MKKFKDIISLPSEALQAMVDGLLEMDARPDFQIDMNEFGVSIGNICFGCAATCAAIFLSKSKYTPETINGPFEDMIPGFEDTRQFEIALNTARSGCLYDLLCYFDIPLRNVAAKLKSTSYRLTTDNWRSQLPLVREHIEKLRAAGY